MKVLVTGAGALLGQGIIKSLRMSNTHYDIIAVDPDPRSVGLFWADSACTIPMVKDPSYFHSIWEVIDRERPDAILIGTDVELELFALHREELESSFNTHVIVSSPQTIKIADDKWLTYEFLSSRGLSCPLSALPNDRSAVQSLIDRCGFPLIVKPRIGARSVGVEQIFTEEQLWRTVEAIPGLVVQECVADPDAEYTTGIVAFERVQAVVTMRRDLRDGNTYRAYVEPDSPFDSILSNIAQELTVYGPVNFQFRVADGVPKIFEINARFSGTTPLRALAGFNEVDATLRYVVEGTPIEAPTVKRIAILRYWDEIIVDLDSLEALGSGRAI